VPFNIADKFAPNRRAKSSGTEQTGRCHKCIKDHRKVIDVERESSFNRGAISKIQRFPIICFAPIAKSLVKKANATPRKTFVTKFLRYFCPEIFYSQILEITRCANILLVLPTPPLDITREIEAYANATIARLLKGKMTIQRRGGPREMNAEDIERNVSTSEKIAVILPALLNAPSIKGGSEWQSFDNLKNIRDASIHFKSGDQYPGSGKAEKNSLYYSLMNSNPHEFPMTAVRVILRLADNPPPRWLTHLIEKYHVK